MTPAECATVTSFLAREKEKQHTEYEVLRRDREVLIRQQRSNPMSVRADRLDTAARLVEEARIVDAYLGRMLAGMPAVTS